METKDQARSDLEPSSQQSSLDTARTMLQQGASIQDVMAKSGLSEPRVRGLKGVLIKAQKRLEAANKPTKAETKPETMIQAKIKPQLEATVGNNGHKLEESSQQGSSSNVLDKLAYYQKLPAKDAIVQLVKENSMLAAQVNRNNGHGTAPFQYPHSDGELEHEMAENLKWKRYNGMIGENTLTKDDVERIVEKTVTKAQKEVGSDPKGLDYILKLIEVLRGLNPGPQRSQAEEALTTLALSLVKENTQARGASNMVDLKIQELLQTERLENKKIDFEIQKHEEGKESEKAIYKLVGDAIGADGIVGKLASGLGSMAKNHVERGSQPSVPKVIEVPCPQCQKPIRAVEGTPQIVCQGCGAVLTRQNQPQPQPQPPQQPQPEPQPQQTQQEKPQETEQKPGEKPEQEVI